MPRVELVDPAGPSDIATPCENDARAARYLLGFFDVAKSSTGEPQGTVIDQADLNLRFKNEKAKQWRYNFGMRIDRQGYNNKGNIRYCRYALQSGSETYACIIMQMGFEFGETFVRNAFLQSLTNHQNAWLHV